MPLQNASRENEQSRHRWKAAAGLFAVVFLVYVVCGQRQIFDSKYSMLLSNELLRGSTTLDRYFDGPGAWARSYHVTKQDGHFYYVYPAGTSVLSMPYVALVNLGTSQTFRTPSGDYNWLYEERLQWVLAALLMSGLAVVTYRMACLSLPRGWPFAIAVVVALGTQILSTTSRGMWSHTWGILLLGLAVSHLHAVHRQARPLQPALLATLLAWCFFTRPTFVVSGVVVGVWLLTRDWRAAVRYVLAAVFWAAMFLVWSRVSVGQWVPGYYQGGLLTAERFVEALLGHLISPSRGLFVYVPVSGVVLYLLARYFRDSSDTALLATAVAAIVIHWIVASANQNWWGGHCYGPRVLADVLPWWSLLFVLAVRGWLSAAVPERRRRREYAIAAAAVMVSVFVNGAGAISGRALAWNAVPTNVDASPERLWDWTDPQFLRPFRPEVHHRPVPSLVEHSTRTQHADARSATTTGRSAQHPRRDATR